MVWRSRRSNFRYQPPIDTTRDDNGNGYPDVFEAQEAALLAQINARRKQYMDRMGRAQDRFADQNPAPVDDNSYTEKDDTNIGDLFSGDPFGE